MSAALREGIEYASQHGVFVVTAAGDRGDELSELASYPAAWSQAVPGLVAVAGVDRGDQLVTVSGRYSNFGASQVALAAPGQSLIVAEPREGEGELTSTGAAAALVAGALARGLDPDQERSPEAMNALVLRALQSARKVESLSSKVGYGVIRVTE